MIIKLLIEGGDMKPGPAVAQQLGPMGVNIGKVISDVNQATQQFKGMKVPVELDIDEKTKDFTVKTSSPPTSELLKKELNLEKGSSDHKNFKMGNASIEDVIKVAKVKYSNMLEKNFKNAIKSILGTYASVGVLVENQEPNELIKEVEAGKFDKEIDSQLSETSPEKRKKLNEYYKEVKAEQDARLEAERKEAEEAAKAAEEAGKEGEAPKEGEAKEGAEAAKPEAGAKTEEKPAEEKKEEKK